MKYLLLVLSFFAFNVSALENEDCKFVDALGQHVTEAKVSCKDKIAEVEYINQDMIVTSQIDLLKADDFYFENLEGENANNRFLYSLQTTSSCNAISFRQQSRKYGSDRHSIFVFKGSDSKNFIGDSLVHNYTKISTTGEITKVSYKFLIEEKVVGVSVHLCLKSYNADSFNQYFVSYQSYNFDSAANSRDEAYFWVSVVEYKVENFSEQPYQKFKEYVKSKYFGEFKAVPINNIQQDEEQESFVVDFIKGYDKVWAEHEDDGLEGYGNVRIEDKFLVLDDSQDSGVNPFIIGGFDLTDKNYSSIDISLTSGGNLEGSDSFFVEVSTDNGSNWTRVITTCDDYSGVLNGSFTPSTEGDTLIKLSIKGFAGDGEKIKIDKISIN